MGSQETLVIIKPDAIVRGLMGAVLSRLETLDATIIGAKMVRVSEELAKMHYAHLREKPFYREVVEHLQGKLHGTESVMALVLRGANIVERVREVAGATNPEQAAPSSLRGAFGRMTTAGVMENVLHASSDAKEAEQEIARWFTPEELIRTPAGRTATSTRGNR